MLVDDLMTRSVATAAADASVQDLARLMRDQDAGIVVLVAGDSPVGVLTDRDLTLAVVAADTAGDRRALTCASSPVISVEAGSELADAVRLMRRHGIARVLVCSAGRLTGMVSASGVALATGDVGALRQSTGETARTDG